MDRLDPEERAAAAASTFADWRGEDLAPATKRQIGRVLALPESQLAAASLEEVSHSLGLGLLTYYLTSLEEVGADRPYSKYGSHVPYCTLYCT